jgi:hypothetical protein
LSGRVSGKRCWAKVLKRVEAAVIQGSEHSTAVSRVVNVIAFAICVPKKDNNITMLVVCEPILQVARRSPHNIGSEIVCFPSEEPVQSFRVCSVLTKITGRAVNKDGESHMETVVLVVDKIPLGCRHESAPFTEGYIEAVEIVSSIFPMFGIVQKEHFWQGPVAQYDAPISNPSTFQAGLEFRLSPCSFIGIIASRVLNSVDAGYQNANGRVVSDIPDTNIHPGVSFIRFIRITVRDYHVPVPFGLFEDVQKQFRGTTAEILSSDICWPAPRGRSISGLIRCAVP